ncbi:Rod binding protein [SAR116 cluster alpha proteobacterium HIMB100]|nr:Rod binding protein [SAR116 cluster alpha proteobacterium HIMB100]
MEIMHKIDPLLAANLTKTPDTSADLREVAEQFEAIFINQFLAQSRKTKLADDLFGNKGTETYNSLLDQERAQQLANSVDLGIADALVRQLGGNQGAE